MGPLSPLAMVRTVGYVRLCVLVVSVIPDVAPARLRILARRGECGGSRIPCGACLLVRRRRWVGTPMSSP